MLLPELNSHISKRLTALAVLVIAGCSDFDDPSLKVSVPLTNPPAEARPALPYLETKQALFGDLHIHTSLSTDAYILGVRTLPDDVYRYAKGEVISHAAGYNIQINRPLDFVAVTDHAEYLGQARVANLDISTTRMHLSEILSRGGLIETTLTWLDASRQIRDNGFSPGGEARDTGVNKDAWNQTINAAERHNLPGRFTTFIGYEWSGHGSNLTEHMHRNVIFRSRAVAELPFSQLDSNDPAELWRFLDAERAAGREAMAIPHNSNFSGGRMFAPRSRDGLIFDAAYADLRARNEPVVEILQIKGSSETHPILSTEDEFANFENIKESLFIPELTYDNLRGAYYRDALQTGLEYSAKDGFNPFKYGAIGSSDSHNASSPSEENRYTGKLPMLDGSAGLRTNEALLLPDGINPVTSWGSGGLAVVWAEENTRDSIYAALRRKETYATSGPRILVRFFASWNYSPDLLETPDFIERTYQLGVPMGGELTADLSSSSPTFVVTAAKDPDGANLDRVQIIKGWVDENGETHEKVFDVAASDSRTVNNSELGPVGNTVDAAVPSYTNSIGGPSIEVLWQDPEYSPSHNAFYYVRVLEIPTPRWSTYDAVTLGIEPMEPVTIQERAITSPIWVKPDNYERTPSDNTP